MNVDTATDFGEKYFAIYDRTKYSELFIQEEVPDCHT